MEQQIHRLPVGSIIMSGGEKYILKKEKRDITTVTLVTPDGKKVRLPHTAMTKKEGDYYILTL